MSELGQAVDDLSREIANETSGAAMGVTKRLIADIQGTDLYEALAHAVQINASARQSADCRAGIAAFLEGKDPPWKRD
jgi:methylglutaconyl-CoA hydratase